MFLVSLFSYCASEYYWLERTNEVHIMSKTQGFLRVQLNCLELPTGWTLIQATNNTAKDRLCIGLTKIKGIRSISCIYWRVQFHTPNLSLLISNLAWYSWLIRMAWSSSNSPPAPCLFQLRSLRLPGTAAVGTQSMGKCETDQKRDTLAVSTGWQLGLTIGNLIFVIWVFRSFI